MGDQPGQLALEHVEAGAREARPRHGGLLLESGHTRLAVHLDHALAGRVRKQRRAERGGGTRATVVAHDLAQRGVDQRVAVQHGDLLAAAEALQRVAHAPGGAHELALHHHLDLERTALAAHEVEHLVGEVVSVDHHEVGTLALEVVELV